MKEIKHCVICGKELQGNQRLYCSNSCKQKGHYRDIKENPNTTFIQTIRSYRRKLALIDLKGGKCEKCGYAKNISALDFHHLDPSTKDFSLDARNLSNKNWEALLEESKKCILLCSNCHREIHHPDMTREQIEQLKGPKEYSDLLKNEIDHYKICPICGTKFLKSTNKTYCSDECKEKAKFKDKQYPSYEEINLKYKEYNSWTKVANYYGLTRKIIIGIRDRYLKKEHI